MRPLWTLLCQPTRFARAAANERRGPEREVLRVYRLSLFLRKRVMFTCSLTKSKINSRSLTEALGPHIVRSFVSLHRSVLIDLETVTARRAQQPRVSRGLKARGRGSTRRQGGHRQEEGYGRRKCPPHGFPSVFIAQWADEDMRYALAPRAHSTRAQRRWS